MAQGTAAPAKVDSTRVEQQPHTHTYLLLLWVPHSAAVVLSPAQVLVGLKRISAQEIDGDGVHDSGAVHARVLVE
jgi:hypothetical protein